MSTELYIAFGIVVFILWGLVSWLGRKLFDLRATLASMEGKLDAILERR
jgi:hypothetical protein